MFAAASKKGGVGGVPQSVGKDFADADKGGKLPEHKRKKWTQRPEAEPETSKSKRESFYSHKRGD
jgi:hypothetical protein